MENFQFPVCEICTLEFNEKSDTPTILPSCGHTFCISCVTEIMKQNPEETQNENPEETQNENPKCPKCRTPITTPLLSLPKNYSLLQTINANRSLKNTKIEWDMLRSMLVCQNEEISEFISQFSERLSYNQEMIKVINKLKKKLVDETIFKSFEEIREQYQETRDTLWNCQREHTIDLQDSTSEEYIQNLNDLRVCLQTRNLHTFMKIPDEDNSEIFLLIKMFSNPKSSEVVNLCTGECGECYKGYFNIVPTNTPVKCKSEFASLLLIPSKGVITNNEFIDYAFTEDDVDTNCSPKELFIKKFGGNDYCFAYSENGLVPEDSLGKLIIPSDLQENLRDAKTYYDCVIIDCGIAINIKSNFSK